MRILGIEFGSWSVKAVEMESRFRRLEILDFHEVKLPLKVLEPTKVYAEATQQILAGLVEANKAEIARILDEDHVGNVLDDRVEEKVGVA